MTEWSLPYEMTSRSGMTSSAGDAPSYDAGVNVAKPRYG
jgi:hypothetical protein